MIERLTLITRTLGKNADGLPVYTETRRDVFCGLRSIGQQEFYQSHATDFRPEIKFVLADYLEYNGETLAEYDGRRYRIIRTYRTGQTLELVAQRASKEEGGTNG